MTKGCFLIFLGIVMLIGSACNQGTSIELRPVTPPTLDSDPLPIIIDIDMAIDDWLAIVYLLSRPEVEVKAITVTGAGEAHCPTGTRNALDLLYLAGWPEVPVACGRETPLVTDHEFPSSWREQVDSLLGISLPPSPQKPFEGPAVRLLVQTIQGSSKPLHILALGPLTNLAELFEQEPALVEKVAMITIMGGAVEVPGNVGISSPVDNQTAEWNIYIDPQAAQQVFNSGAPITLVLLDATNDAPVTMEFLRKLERDRATPLTEFVFKALEKNEERIKTGRYFFWDPLAAALITDGHLAEYTQWPLTVIEEVGPHIGRTQINDQGNPIRVASSADLAGFEMAFLSALNSNSVR